MSQLCAKSLCISRFRSIGTCKQNRDATCLAVPVMHALCRFSTCLTPQFLLQIHPSVYQIHVCRSISTQTKSQVCFALQTFSKRLLYILTEHLNKWRCKLTKCPKWTLVKVNILSAELESLMAGWMFSFRSFSMYIPKKGQACSNT